MLAGRQPLLRHVMSSGLQRSISARRMSVTARYPLDEPLPELPAAPRYPCPFIIESDIEKYLLPLYRTGWGISRTLDATTTPPATQLSKRIVFPNTDIAGIFMKDALSMITERENHHPAWDSGGGSSSTDIHVHTHTALAPDGRQNVDDQVVLSRKRPGITLRDIRYAILFEGLLRDYLVHGFIEPTFLAVFPQHADINSVHNFRLLAPHLQVPQQS